MASRRSQALLWLPLILLSLALTACNQQRNNGNNSGGGGGGGGSTDGTSATVKLPSPPPGALQFGQRRFATAFEVTGLCSGDFDNDGDLDVAATGNDGDTWIHINDGSGELRAKRKMRFNVATSAPVSADIDLDGDDDLVVLQRAQDRARVLRSKGNGAFKAIDVVFTVAGPRVAHLADLSGDGLPDLVVGGTLNASVHLNLGDGDFGPAIPTPLSTLPVANVLFEDVAGDATPELLFVDQNRLKVMTSQPDGNFVPLISTLGSWGGPLALADVDGDGHLDAVTGGCDQGVGLYLGQGDGTFVPAGNEALTGCRTSTACGDFDGDGFADVVVTHGTDLSILRGSATGLQPAKAHPLGQGRGLVVDDFDGDGQDDVVAGNWTLSQIALHRGLGDGTIDAAPYFDLGTDPIVSIGDVNADSIPDFVAPPRNVVLGLGSGDFDVPGLLPSAFAGRAAFEDMNLDTVPDMIGSGATIYLGDGTTVGSPTGHLSGSSPVTLSTDLDGDFIADVLTTLPTTDEMYVLLGNGDGTLAPAVAYPTGDHPSSVGLADLNGDLLPDAVTCNRNSDDLTVYYGAADGSFHSPLTLPASVRPVDLALGDFNGDLHTDIAVAAEGLNNTPGSLDIYLGRGDGTFQTRKAIAAMGPVQVRAGDFDQDGALDLVVAASNVRLFLGRGNGKFHLPASFNVGQATVESLAVGDVTGDGWLDVIAGNQNKRATVLVNHGPALAP